MQKAIKYTIGCLLIGLLLPVQAVPQATTERESVLVTYREGSTVNVRLGTTGRLPGASGEVRVRRRLGTTEIEMELDGMKPAISFRGDFNTYVLWTVSPEGIAINIGEFVLQGARSKLTVTTPLTSFFMFVSAEPHFLVKQPSRLIILENTATGLEKQKGATTATFDYQPPETGYKYEIASLASQPETEGRLRSDRYQAIIAVRFADEAFAEQFAPEEFAAAQEALSQVQQGFAQGLDERQISLLAHRTVRLAVEAQTAGGRTCRSSGAGSRAAAS